MTLRTIDGTVWTVKELVSVPNEGPIALDQLPAAIRQRLARRAYRKLAQALMPDGVEVEVTDRGGRE